MSLQELTSDFSSRPEGIGNAIVGPVHFLSWDLGLTWTDESSVQSEDDLSYLGAVLGFEYKWQISETAWISQEASYFSNFEESKDWRFTSDSRIQAQLLNHLADEGELRDPLPK